MDYSAANTRLWDMVIQFGTIAGIILFANILRRKVPFIKKSLMPTAVLGGFLLLLLRAADIIRIDMQFLEMITYHGIALGFIALSLRAQNNKSQAGNLAGPKSGALIVSTYLVQGMLGLIISLLLAYTVMPGLFKAAGVLLPMGYGQGPGQANNVGTAYQNLGFAGGRSFGLSIAAAGYLSACVVGVIYINILHRKGKIKATNHDEVSGSVTVDTFQDSNEVPISESVDRLSVQAGLVLLVYFLTYLVCYGISELMNMLGAGIANTVNTLLWGFNFIVGSIIAMLLKLLFKGLRKVKVMHRQYQNNYLLSRISGLAFDVMIIAGVASINISDLEGLWVPFLLMAVLGAFVTLFYLQWVSRKIYKDYFYAGLLSMYGMMTGTISSGVLLLREVDPHFDTPAANNLVTGTSVAVVFGAPMLVLIGVAPDQPILTFGLMAVYFALLLLFMLKVKGKKVK
ncbi:MAG: sodium:glutamate symporter [Clostridiales bacterium]|jgi:ESS family glutamate:Na+ symporter|nr:sodium:glutamate symporter [Clostridiales bacterium]